MHATIVYVCAQGMSKGSVKKANAVASRRSFMSFASHTRSNKPTLSQETLKLRPHNVTFSQDRSYSTDDSFLSSSRRRSSSWDNSGFTPTPMSCNYSTQGSRHPRDSADAGSLVGALFMPERSMTSARNSHSRRPRSSTYYEFILDHREAQQCSQLREGDGRGGHSTAFLRAPSENKIKAKDGGINKPNSVEKMKEASMMEEEIYNIYDGTSSFSSPSSEYNINEKTFSASAALSGNRQIQHNQNYSSHRHNNFCTKNSKNLFSDVCDNKNNNKDYNCNNHNIYNNKNNLNIYNYNRSHMNMSSDASSYIHYKNDSCSEHHAPSSTAAVHRLFSSTDDVHEEKRILNSSSAGKHETPPVEFWRINQFLL